MNRPVKQVLQLTLLLLVVLLSIQNTLAQSSLPRLPRPTGLRLEGNTLHWQAVEGVSGYRVRHRLPGQPWQGTNLPPTQTSFVLSGLQPDVVYLVQVRAQGSTGVIRNSFWSNSLRVRLTQTPTPTVSPTPESRLARVSNMRFTDSAGAVAWDAVAGNVLDYVLAYRQGHAGAFTAVAVAASNAPAWRIPDFDPARVWQLRARARHTSDRSLNGPRAEC